MHQFSGVYCPISVVASVKQKEQAPSIKLASGEVPHTVVQGAIVRVQV